MRNEAYCEKRGENAIIRGSRKFNPQPPTKMNTYSYATDATSGTVQAASLAAAYDLLRAQITDEMIADGATLWVESPGDRLTMGRNRD